MIWALITSVIVILAGLSYILLIAWDAKRDTKNAPREDMVECHTGRHGPYPKKFSIEVGDLGTDHPVLICPLCYQDSIEKAKQNWKEKEAGK